MTKPTSDYPELDDSEIGRILATEPHRIGSHSDDFSSDGDKLCYCTATQKLKALMIRERVKELKSIVTYDSDLAFDIQKRIAELEAQLSASSKGGK